MPTSRYKMVPTKVSVGTAAAAAFNSDDGSSGTTGETAKEDGKPDTSDSDKRADTKTDDTKATDTKTTDTKTDDKPDTQPDKPADTGTKSGSSGVSRPSANEDEAE